jgi:dynein heavy chain
MFPLVCATTDMVYVITNEDYGTCAGKFAAWTDLVTDVPYNPGAPMASVFVPTAETSSLRYFLDMMITLRKPIMFVGGAGVGETPLLHLQWINKLITIFGLSLGFSFGLSLGLR